MSEHTDRGLAVLECCQAIPCNPCTSACKTGAITKDSLTSLPVFHPEKCIGCRMCVAGPAGFADDESRALRVATKFVHIARDHYERRGRDIDIIKLNGSIELAPILGLADVIVDIVETGTTLRENDLTVLEEFMPISARLIANKASYKFKHAQMTELLTKMKEALA